MLPSKPRTSRFGGALIGLHTCKDALMIADAMPSAETRRWSFMRWLSEAERSMSLLQETITIA